MNKQRTRRGLPCPICNREHGCAIFRDSGWVMCLRGQQGDTTPGYKFHQVLGGGMGAMFKPVNFTPSFSNNNYHRRDHPYVAGYLSFGQRHQQYSTILDQLALDKEHRLHLLKRGFDDCQIQTIGFKTWQPGKVMRGVSMLLPGIDKTGSKLLGSYGIALPVRNPQGQILAIMLRTAREEKKYIWVSSYHPDIQPEGARPNLSNRELPLDCQIPENPISGVIGLCEGVCIKPALAAFKVNQIMIGASGGNFSPQTLADYVDGLRKRSGFYHPQFLLYPDSSSVLNSSVMRRYQEAIRQIDLLGYVVHIAWWEQVDKSAPDIDELASQTVGYLSPRQFYDIHTKLYRKIS